MPPPRAAPSALGLSIGGDSGAYVALRTWVDGEGEAFVPMTGEPEGDHLRFSCEFTREDPAIVWYSFVIEAL